MNQESHPSMRKINWTLVNLAFWAEIILSYVLPFHMADAIQYQVGFPLPFLSVYNTAIGVNPLFSLSLNPLSLCFNVAVLYFALSCMVRLFRRAKGTC